MRIDEPAARVLAELEAAEERLARLAATDPPPEGLTEPDSPSGERWEWGQVWAHVAEFPGYWTEQVGVVLDTPGDEPVPFGRTKTDPQRIDSIEANRDEPALAQMERVGEQLATLRGLVGGFREDEWRRVGVHPTRGEMDVERIVDEFVVRHLHDHAAQLEALVGTSRE